MANGETYDGMLRLLEEIRDIQKQQIERQAEALTLQREQHELIKAHYQKAERLQQKAESIQDKSRALIQVARKSFLVIIPVIAVMIVYLSWLLFSI